MVTQSRTANARSMKSWNASPVRRRKSSGRSVRAARNGRRALAKPIDHAAVQRSIDTYTACGNKEEASRRLNVPPMTLKHHLKIAERLGMKPSLSVAAADDPAHLKHRIKLLEK